MIFGTKDFGNKEQGLFWSKDFWSKEQGLFLCTLFFVPYSKNPCSLFIIHKGMSQTTHPLSSPAAQRGVGKQICHAEQSEASVVLQAH